MAPSTKIALSLVASAALVVPAASAQLITEGGRTFTATLSGANEIPPRAETATGEFSVTVNLRQKRLCYELEVQGFDPADPGDMLVGAHIHEGTATENGPIRVHLSLPTDGDSSGCVDNLPTRLLAQIWARPEQYYVNVHTNTFPGGAIRGQLG